MYYTFICVIFNKTEILIIIEIFILFTFKIKKLNSHIEYTIGVSEATVGEGHNLAFIYGSINIYVVDS